MQNRNFPFVSVIVPCRNEERFIGECLHSIIANDYPKNRLEVLVVDGMSKDRTRAIVKEYVQQYPFIKLLDNPKRIIPAAMNIGIKHSSGEIIMKMDAHSVYGEDYISKCVKYLYEYAADNVGGVLRIVPGDDTLCGKGIAFALSNPFGAGDAYFRIGSKKPRWVDTVPFGCYRKSMLLNVGLYDENVAFSEDIVINSKIRQKGGKILLSPDIIINYYARSDLKSFLKHAWRNGVWTNLPFKYTSIIPISLRHIVPLAFISSVMSLGVLSIMSKFFLVPFFLVTGSYLLLNMVFSTAIAFQKRDARLLCVMPIIFGSLHIAYGLGSLIGLVRVITSKFVRAVCFSRGG